MKPRDRQILQIALPSIVSNITVPLLGLIDVAIVGHLGAPAYIGAIAVGGMLFNIIYWIFGFLRMGSSGMTSQALGRRDLPEVVRILLRSVGIGMAVAAVLIALQVPIRQAAFLLIQPTDEVRRMATVYFHICIWGAPAMLGLYGLTGWFIGMQNSRTPMFIAITQNVVNIVASLSLVFGCGMKVEGVALGTLIAQYAGFVMGLTLWLRQYGKLKKYLPGRQGSGADTDGSGLWEHQAMRRFFAVNRDIAQGEIILAVNTLLMQLFTLFSYVMDGFAYAGEAMSGRYIGARNRAAFGDTVRRLFVWGFLMAVLFTLAYAFGGNAFLCLLTDDRQVTAAADSYFGWALAIPAAGVAAFIWDGVFIGATATRGMLLSMAAAAVCFFALHYGLRPVLGNHALWLAFIVYLFVRGAVQTVLSLGVVRRAFASPAVG